MSSMLPIEGTLVNCGAILAGGAAGLLVGRRFAGRFRDIALHALGLSVVMIGLQMALRAADILLVSGSLVLGSLLGESLGLEQWLERAGGRLKRLARSEDSRFVQGFVSASLLFCVGSMAVLGSIEEGVRGDPSILQAKALLDGVMTLALTSTLGAGVLMSAASVLLYQGGLTVLAARLAPFLSPELISSVSATGGLLIFGIGLNVLELARLRVGNMLPAMAFAAAFSLL